MSNKQNALADQSSQKKRKRRDIHDDLNANHHESAKKSVDISSQRTKQELAPFRKNLPVYSHRSKLLELIQKHNALLVVAETGSGKSTQIPAYVHEAGILQRQASLASDTLVKNQSNRRGTVIAVTQPRRVAAMTVARRVAHEIGCKPGTVVGHRVRFEDFTRPDTRIIYMTDGMLLREATSDPLLSRYGIVFLDEAHERSLQTDILFGVVKRAMDARCNASTSTNLTIQEKETTSKDELIIHRMKLHAEQMKLPSLRVVVMSATLDVETFESYFQGAAKIQIPGRQFPVQILYTKEAQEDYIDSTLLTTLQIHEEGEEGDILVFLPGQEDIEDMATMLKQHLKEHETESNEDIVQSISGIGTNLNSMTSLVNKVMVCVLYAALPPAGQMLAFAPKPTGCRRKIILATNIAETSVTLDGIRYVIDCGKHKKREFNCTTGMESLSVSDVCQAQAAQRAGRAGRVSAGFCFRLYTEDAFDSLEPNIVPEILRVNLAQVVLQLKGMGVHDPRTFDFLTPPSPDSLVKAFELLSALDAIDKDMNLTEYGKSLAKLPLDPTFGHLLLQSTKYGCTSEILTSVSMLSSENIFYRQGDANSKSTAAHRRFASHEGDIPTLLNVYEAWRKETKRSKNEEGKVSHGDWCARNFINGRALLRAQDVRTQLRDICLKSKERNGLGMDVDQSCGAERELFFKAVCAGLFLQVATRIQATVDVQSSQNKGNSGIIQSSRGRYKTKIGHQIVSIHPTSTMFARNPAPKCVVYTELLTTKKTYIRGITQIRESWLQDIAPKIYSPEQQISG
jgi:HrpA-like RNA helicase